MTSDVYHANQKMCLKIRNKMINAKRNEKKNGMVRILKYILFEIILLRNLGDFVYSVGKLEISLAFV